MKKLNNGLIIVIPTLEVVAVVWEVEVGAEELEADERGSVNVDEENEARLMLEVDVQVTVGVGVGVVVVVVDEEAEVETKVIVLQSNEW